MTTPYDFLEQARANRTHLNSLQRESYDWRITTCFYSVLHAVNVVFRLLGFPATENHTERFRVLRSQPVFRPILKSYELLYGLSIDSRYRAYPISSLQEETEEAQQLLESIWSFCERFWVAKGLS